MSFANPWALWFLLLLPLVGLYGLWEERRRKALLARAGQRHLLEALIDEGSRAPLIRRVQRLSFALAFVLTTIALARPQFGLRREVLKGRGMDIVLALDLSRSMYARDVVPSRLERAKIELTELLDQVRGDRIALVGFTSVGLPLAPLTVDHAVVRLQLESASPDDLPRGGTSLDAALRAALKLLKAGGHPESDKAIVVITDGEAHLGDPVAAAKEAKEEGVAVHLAGIGSRVGEPIPLIKDGAVSGYIKDNQGKTVVSRLEDSALREVAGAVGGILTLPSDGGGIDLRPIASELQTLKRAQLEERTIEIKEERYMWALGPAFLLLILATLIRPTRNHPLPRLALGLALGLSSPVAEAQELLQRVHPKVQEGLDALQAGKSEEAAKAFKDAQKTLGKSPELRFNQALADASAGELDKAMQGFQQVAEGSENANLRAKAHLALGNAQRKLKRYDEAIASYRKAVVEDPSLSAARRNLEIASRMKVVQQAQPKPEDGEPSESEDGDQGEQQDGDPQDRDEGQEQSEDKGKNESGEQEGQEEGKPDEQSGTEDNSKPEEQDQSPSSDADAGVEDAEEQAPFPEEGGEDAGAGPEAGADSAPSEAAPAEAPILNQQEAEALLDALQAEEKAAKRKRLLKMFKGRPVEKDW